MRVITFIAIDMDGTLINNHHEISMENVKAMKEAEELGYEIVIATGRAHYDAWHLLKGLPLSPYVIGANGATIFSPSGTKIQSTAIKTEQVREIIRWLEEQKLYYEISSRNGIYTPSWGREILKKEIEGLKLSLSKEEFAEVQLGFDKQMNQEGFVFVESPEEILQAATTIYKVVGFTFDEEKRRVGWEKYKNRSDLTIVYSSDYNFELQHPDASKGQALEYLAKILQRDLNPSMAIGDSGNDLSMFKVVSHSFAMGNADEKVKSHAKYVTDTNDQNGVAKAIYRFIHE